MRGDFYGELIRANAALSAWIMWGGMRRRKSAYYREWSKCSTRSRRGLIQACALCLAVAGALVAYLHPELAQSTRLLLWLVPTSAFLVSFVAACARASHDLYRDLEWQHDKTKEQLYEAREAQKAQQSSEMRAVAGLIFQCKREVHCSDDAKFLLLQVKNFLRHRCLYRDVTEFERIFAPITDEVFDDTENAGQIRNKAIQEAVEHLKRVRTRGGNDESERGPEIGSA